MTGDFMSFCTAINCIDGRVQVPVIDFLKKHFQVDYVDVVSEPAPSFILAEQTDQRAIESIFRRVDVSVSHHRSEGIAVVGHHDCAADPASRSEQLSDLRRAVVFLKRSWGELEVIGLWVDEESKVQRISPGDGERRTNRLRQGSLQWGYTLAFGTGWGYTTARRRRSRGKNGGPGGPAHGG